MTQTIKFNLRRVLILVLFLYFGYVFPNGLQ